jgi:ABC-2 type transport system permease protein
VRPVLALVVLELKRFLADRFNLFFVFVLPLVLVGVLGLQSGGGGQGRIALTGSEPTLSQLADRLGTAGVEVTTYPDRGAVEDGVAEGSFDLGVVVEGSEDEPVSLELVAVGAEASPLLEPVVRTAAEQVVLAHEHAAALEEAGLEAVEAGRVAESGPEGWTDAQIAVSDGDPVRAELASMGRFDLGAGGQLLLFVFLNTMTAAASTIQARRSGAMRRVMGAPVTSAQTVTGLALGRFVIALFQGVYIIGASSLLFGVDWGDLGAVVVVLAVFGLISAGLALLIGVLLDAEGPASGIAVGAGLILAALGGCMVPLEFFPDTMRAVANVTPHAWAYQALAEIQRRDGGLLDVLPQLGVLAAMAVVVLAVGTVALRRSLSRAI